MSVKLIWGVSFKKPDGYHDVVDEDGNLKKRFKDVDDAYKWLSEIEEAWESDEEEN